MRVRREESNSSNVIIVGPLPPPLHGAAKITDNVLRHLRTHGDLLAVVNTGTDKKGLRYHATRTWSHAKAVATLLMHHRRPVVVYFGGAGGLGLWYQTGVAFVAKMLGFQIVFHHHNYAYLNRPSRAMAALVKTAGREAIHVSLCEAMAIELRRRYGIARTLVCSNAGFLPGVSVGAPKTLSGDTFTIGHLSNLSVEKGLGLVVDAFRALRKSTHISVSLKLAGPANSDREASILAAAKQEFGPNFQWMGSVTGEDVNRFLSSLDLFVFPSTYKNEAEPLVVLEAARLGVPTVAFEVGCVRTIVPDTNRLVSISSDFVEQTRKIVQAFLADPAAYAAASATTLSHFETRREEGLEAQAVLIRMLQGGHSR